MKPLIDAKYVDAKFVVATISAWMILIGGFYALILHPFLVDEFTKGIIATLMYASGKHLFDEQRDAAVARRQAQAFDVGLQSTPTEK